MEEIDCWQMGVVKRLPRSSLLVVTRTPPESDALNGSHVAEVSGVTHN